MSNTSKLILILDDSELILSMLEMVCGQLGYRVVTASRFDQVADAVADEAPAVILSDLNLPEIPGGEAVEALRAVDGLAETPIILISGIDQGELDQVAQERGAQGALSKDAGLPGMSAQLGPMLERLV